MADDLNTNRVPVDDSLRTRIAALLELLRPVTPMEAADAVIRELGLRPEWGALDYEDGGFLADTREELRPSRGETIKHRYITEWVADE